MNYAFLTFGCRLNRAEALDNEAAALAAGHRIVDAGPEADVIVVRGCSVTARAQRDCEKAIAKLRRDYPKAKVLATGCLEDAKDERQLRSAQGCARVPQDEPGKSETSAEPRTNRSSAVPMMTARAYLKVQDGCAGRCAFCVVPRFRGAPRSIPFTDVKTRAAAFLDAGYREIVVTGCNLALYRSEGRGLGELMGELAGGPWRMADGGREGRWRVRLGSLEPGVCDEAVLKAVAEHGNICRFLHLSVQSGSDAVLKRMNRPYSAAALERFVAAALELVPGLALGADVITGFPGETDAEFEETRNFLGRFPFPNLHVFPYSERPGTTAAAMEPVIPKGIRHARARELEALGAVARAKFAAGFVGREVEVCVEKEKGAKAPRLQGTGTPGLQGPKAKGATGWSGEYLACEVANCAVKRRGLVRVRVVAARGGTLVCRA